jgi:DNA repair protein RecN (Recombination protein N)
MSENGKSRAFVNDTPVNLSILKSLGQKIVEIQTQNTSLMMADPKEQLNIIDDFMPQKQLFLDYKSKFSQYKLIQKKILSHSELLSNQKKQFEFNLFQLNEIADLEIQENEEILLAEKILILTQASKIIESLQTVSNLFSENELSIVQLLSHAKQALKPVATMNESLSAINQRIDSILIETRDISEECSEYSEKIDQDENELERLNDRLSKIQSLMRKHNVQTTTEILAISEELSLSVSNIETIETEILAFQKELDFLFSEVIKIGTAISNARIEASKELTIEVESILKELSLLHAKIEFRFESGKDLLSETGLDKVSLYFTANPGTPIQLLSEVASGGEISRLNFAFRSILAKHKSLPTLIFDEADTGISGETAGKMGKLLKQMGEIHQVLCITHLPQVAACGHHQLGIVKLYQDNDTKTIVKSLSNEERIEAVAKMLSGDTITAAALENAKQLIITA